MTGPTAPGVRPHWYVLDADHNVVACDDTLVAADWFEQATKSGERIVAQTQIRDGAWVSTVFLGLDHRYAGEGPPLVFETMAFTSREEWCPGMDDREAREVETATGIPVPKLLTEGGWDIGSELRYRRCSTWNEAVIQHERMVERFGFELGEQRKKGNVPRGTQEDRDV